MFDKNDLTAIKNRVYEEEKVEDILNALECEYIKLVGNRYEAGLPLSFGSRNRRSVQVYMSESLPSKIRNKNIKGDIFSIIGYILYDAKDFDEVGENLFQIKCFVCNLFEWDEYLTRQDDFEEIVEKKDHLIFLRDIQKKRKKRSIVARNTDKENRILDKYNSFSRYVNLPHKNFLDDGIDIPTQLEFEVMFDMESERVVFPIYNRLGELVSVKGRYVGSNKDTMKDMKYLYLYNFNKGLELFNLNKAEKYIRESGEVIVFESEKSCMKAWQFGVKNTVAISGFEITPYQLYTLRTLEANIVFAFDNDVSIEDIKKQSSPIKTRKTFYIKDTLGLLGEKSSPVDKGKKIWLNLYENCMRSIG